mgnify:CR=1 FL=1
MRQPASIFNDVIGPVMIGPSSSHTAASVRIGRMLRQMANGNPKKVIFEFEPNGSLATTYHGQGSDFGLVGGLLGYETYDTRIVDSLKEAKNLGIEVEFNVVNYEASHPNTYKTTIFDIDGNKTHATFISTGGGMIELTEIEDVKISITGGFYETIVILKNVEREDASEIKKQIQEKLKEYDFISINEENHVFIIDIKNQNSLDDDFINEVKRYDAVSNIISLSPVLPIKSQKNYDILFRNAADIEKIADEHNMSLWEVAVAYESAIGGISKHEVYNKMKEIVNIINNSIEKGKKGTSYDDRILGHQSSNLEKEGLKLIPGDVFNSIIKHVTLLMEIKSSMGVIVAAPTAGSCGAVPGSIIGTAKELGLDYDEITKAMLTAGIIGVLIAEKSTFAAEVCGCQAECGSGSGMAAAGLVQLMGGSAKQCIDAASMALQNVFGLVCDPVADRVEVPCLGKNVMAGTNAMAAANMVLAGFDKVIPLDETIESLYKVGTMLPPELRCTGNGGLSITKTSKSIHEKLLRNNN